jgi:hypothetical protein
MIKPLSLCLCLFATVLISCNSSETNNKAETTDSTNTNTTMNTQTASLTDDEKNEGWQLLFDGSSTTGWHSYGKISAGSSWKTADGVLYLDSTKTDGKRDEGDLVTDKEYENFHLSLDWKLAPGGNSGIIFLINEDTAKYKRTYETGPEMQVLDNSGHADGKIEKHHAGDLYDLIACSTETVKPVGEWNHAEIKLDKGKLDFYLNGTNVVFTTMWDDNWNKMVANSKFKNMPGFAKFKKGRIALQDHGDPVWYRNIKIKEL